MAAPSPPWDHGCRRGLRSFRSAFLRGERTGELAVALRREPLRWDEAERRAVDAVAKPRGPWTVVEDVAEMASRVLAFDLDVPRRLEGRRIGLDDVRRRERPREARPTGAAVELVLRAEQRLAGDDVDVDPGV